MSPNRQLHARRGLIIHKMYNYIKSLLNGFVMLLLYIHLRLITVYRRHSLACITMYIECIGSDIVIEYILTH